MQQRALSGDKRLKLLRHHVKAPAQIGDLVSSPDLFLDEEGRWFSMVLCNHEHCSHGTMSRIVADAEVV